MFCFLVMFTLWQIIYFSTIIFTASLLLLMDGYICICVCVCIIHIYDRLHQYYLSQINEHSCMATQKSGYFIANMSFGSSNMSATSESHDIVTRHSLRVLYRVNSQDEFLYCWFVFSFKYQFNQMFFHMCQFSTCFL